MTFLILLLFLPGLLSVPWIFLIVYSWRRLNLRRHGVTVGGRITRRGTYFVPGTYEVPRGSYIKYVAYSYDYQGKTYTRSQYVDNYYYSVLTEGRLVSVRCAAHHPTRALLEGPAGKRTIRILKLTLVGSLFIGGLLLGMTLYFLFKPYP